MKMPLFIFRMSCLAIIGLGVACSSQSGGEAEIEAASIFTESFCDQIQALAESTGYTQGLIQQIEDRIGFAPTEAVEGNQTNYTWGNQTQGLTLMITEGGGGTFCHYVP